MGLKKNKVAGALKTFLLGSVVALPLSLQAHAETLQEAVQQALATNPDIGAIANNREAIDQELRQARGLYLPQIDINAGIGLERTDDSTTRARSSGSEGFEPSNASLVVQQRLFDGFEASSTTDRELARVKAAANTVRENAEFLSLDAIGAYVEVLRQRDLLALAQENVAIHVEIINSLQERLEAGGGSTADVAQAEARAASARNTLTETYNALRDAEADYARIIGHFPDELVQPETVVTTLPDTLDAAVDAAVNDNPTVQISKANVETAEAEVELTDVPFYPSVDIVARSDYEDQVSSTRGNYTENYSVGLELNWNLFRGGIDTANRQEALARLAESKNNRYASVVNAQREMRQSWFALEAARQSVSDLAAAVQFNTETRDAYREQFEVAQRTLLDVLDAENELFVNRGQLVTAMVNEQLAAYRVLALSGDLLGTLDVAAPDQAAFEDHGWAEGLFQ
ncbi:TolC family outer membrane protein [Kiloniella sp. b19]|uniref:TolC family outer membrane protein n=1 Tax=Kiloniella sp. GXU_MW_B19 TaxID=3141326 RepID=UPI0031D4170F